MDEAHKRAQATRKRNLEARAAMYREQAEAMRVARLALQRVTEREDAAAAELLEAVRQLNADFSLGLPLHRQPTPEDLQAARRREVAEAHRAFEVWRTRTIGQLNAAYRIGHEELKNAAALDDLTEATGFMSLAEYLSDTLSYGTAA